MVELSMLEKARSSLDNIYLDRGRGKVALNTQRVLDALWKASDIMGKGSYVERHVFEYSLAKFRRYFFELEKLGCVELIQEEDGRGKPLIEIKLVKREMSIGDRDGIQKKKAAKKQRAIIITKGKIPDIDLYSPLPEKITTREVEQVSADAHVLAVVPRKESAAVPAYIFVDVPNIILPNYDATNEIVTLRLAYVNWIALRGLAHLNYAKPAYIKEAFAYLKSSPRSDTGEWYIDARMRRAGFTPVYSSGMDKDIDTLMTADIVSKSMQEIARGNSVMIHIFAGDWGYSRALDNIQESAKEKGVECIARIYTWRKKASAALSGRVPEENVTYIDDFIGWITLPKWATDWNYKL